SCGKSMSLETPQEVNFFRGGSSHAHGKRPPAVKGNGVTLKVLLNRLKIINKKIFKTKHITRGDKNEQRYNLYLGRVYCLFSSDVFSWLHQFQENKRYQ